MASRLRNVWLVFHRWLGLTAGLLFAVMGLTGSLIVFRHAVDEQLNAGMLLSRQSGTPMSLEEIIAKTREASPAPGKIANIFYPRVPNGVFTLHFRGSEKAAKGDTIEVFVDPVTGETLGQRARETGLVALIYRLHSTVLAGETGRMLLGGMSFLAFISLCSGIILWWSYIRKGIRIGLSIRPQLFLFDLHKSLGAVFFPILLLVLATSNYLTLPGLIKPAVKLVSDETKLPVKLKSTVPESDATPIGADAAGRVAEQIMPGCRLMSIELPSKADDSYRVFVRQQGEVGEVRGVGRVWVDQYSGECLATRDWNKFTFADTFFRIQLAIHTGDAFGPVGRWIFLVAGLIPMVLYVTGFIIWRRRISSRVTRQPRTVPSNEPSHSRELVANQETVSRV